MGLLAKFPVKIPKVRALGKMEGQMERINQAKRNGSTWILRVLIRSWFKMLFILLLSWNILLKCGLFSHGVKLIAACGYFDCSVCLHCFSFAWFHRVANWLVYLFIGMWCSQRYTEYVSCCFHIFAVQWDPNLPIPL